MSLQFVVASGIRVVGLFVAGSEDQHETNSAGTLAW